MMQFLHFCPSRTNELLIELKIADCSNIFFIDRKVAFHERTPCMLRGGPLKSLAHVIIECVCICA